jgi:hypothetical protein
VPRYGTLRSSLSAAPRFRLGRRVFSVYCEGWADGSTCSELQDGSATTKTEGFVDRRRYVGVRSGFPPTPERLRILTGDLDKVASSMTQGMHIGMCKGYSGRG